MHMLAIAVAAFSAVLLGLSFGGYGGVPVYVPVAGLVLAAIVYLSAAISIFLRTFIAVYAASYMVLAAFIFAGGMGWLPEAVMGLMPPGFAPVGSVAFALIVYGIAHIPVIRTIMALVDPFFESRDAPRTTSGPMAWFGRSEGAIGVRLLALMIAINMFQVVMQIRLNIWYGDLFNALQQYNASAFWWQIFGVFVPLAAVWITVAIYEVFVDATLDVRWRTWLTERMYGRWLADGTQYRMQFSGQAADNPDQRIQQDVKEFIQRTMSLSIRMLAQAITLVSFVVILWNISRTFVIPYFNTTIPGFMVGVAVVYAVVGTLLTHFIGKPLVQLDFRQEKVEADFRFSLARLREYAEQVALLRGAKAEEERLSRSFFAVVSNYIAILYRRMKLVGFTASWSQLSVVFPYLIAGPSFFARIIDLGTLQRTISAYSRVESALSFFINSYQTLAAYKAGVDRLTSFNDAMSVAENRAAEFRDVSRADDRSSGLNLTDANITLPDGRQIVSTGDLRFRAGESVLITGPSGSGKSTLFRVIAGIWPFGTGSIDHPANAKVMLLPQRPYIPSGALRLAIVYPAVEGAYSDEEIRDALRAVRLGHLADRLDEDDLWFQRLSGGEQQRLQLARALLAKPDWLFLDEATASLDEPLEAEMYKVLSERLPDTTVVSIGHRSTLVAMHDRQIVMSPNEDGGFTPKDRMPAAVPGE